MILYRYKYLPTGQYLFKIFKNIPAALTKTGKIYSEPMQPFVAPVLEVNYKTITTSAQDWEEEVVEIKVISRTKLK